MEAGDRLATAATHGIVGAVMNELRELRRAAGLGQREFAALLSIPVETFRPLDSGRRVASAAVLQRARDAAAYQRRQHELLPLARLAGEFDVHIRTLQAAVRTGRLTAQFSVRSVFGRPRRLATRAAASEFMATHYGRFSGQAMCAAPLPTVPENYDEQLRVLRRRLGLTQHDLARRIGAAGKAVIYQWESRKRTPSPVLWRGVIRLERYDEHATITSVSEAAPPTTQALSQVPLSTRPAGLEAPVTPNQAL